VQLRGRRLRLSDDERRRLAVIGQRLGRRILDEIATIVTPDTTAGRLRHALSQRTKPQGLGNELIDRPPPQRPGVLFADASASVAF
jgi:hypothetical protein